MTKTIQQTAEKKSMTDKTMYSRIRAQQTAEAMRIRRLAEPLDCDDAAKGWDELTAGSTAESVPDWRSSNE